MTRLIELLKRLGADAKLAEVYKRNPQKVMEETGLNKEEMMLLKEGDTKKLKDATGLGSLKKTNIIVKAYDQ
ncbi:hypothetical protein [Thiolapillus brandeum]|uniref:Extradiol ring-cleavage dioxygenase LigAB LigA subunit domain-containing protein n=1 Tax=Thiolapillus brandeum TaxID=1076588 RepID=A0A7U6GJL9_9GAMM|nr:hypothetical protein [Thiolapillus brandeum]BAO44780.1 conserved hypothetical protein [Thiolapillus brandeum]